MQTLCCGATAAKYFLSVETMIFTAHQRSCGGGGNVFTHVCLVSGRAHMIITHNAMNLTVHPRPTPLNMGHHWTGTPSSGTLDTQWAALDTCSNMFT